MNELVSNSKEQAVEEVIPESISDQSEQNKIEESIEPENASEIIMQVSTCEQSKISTTEDETNDKNALLTINVESTPAEAEKSALSPPRKSARLSLKRRLSSTDCDSSSSRCDSPIPRRRSTRLNSNAVQEAAKSDEKNKKLPAIIELNTVAETTPLKTQQTGNEIKTKAEDELVDELASAFVEEFVNNE